jgi:hypothetical protein
MSPCLPFIALEGTFAKIICNDSEFLEPAADQPHAGFFALGSCLMNSTRQIVILYLEDHSVSSCVKVFTDLLFTFFFPLPQTKHG